MFTRLDFVSETTGRTYLKALFDTPPEGFTRKLSFDLWRKLDAFRKDLEKFASKESGQAVHIRMSLDCYEACVFWYLVLFRPVFIEKDPVFDGRTLNVYEMLQKKGEALALKRLDMGVIWDEENNWLVLVWEEALKGVLDELMDCPSWRKVVEDEEKRLGRKLDWTWWKKCAESFSFVIPEWRLTRLGYIKGKIWHRPGARYDNITVMDLAGIDVPRIEAKTRGYAATLPVAKRARFAHHYVEEEDRRTYAKSILQFERDARRKTSPDREAIAARRVAKQRHKRAEEKLERESSPLGIATRAIWKLSTALGKGFQTGRRKKEAPSVREVSARFQSTVDAFTSGRLGKSRWKEVRLATDEIQSTLGDLPVEYIIVFTKWLLWSTPGGKGIEAYLAQQRDDMEEYNRLYTELNAETQAVLEHL